MRPEKLFPEVTEEEKKKGARGWVGRNWPGNHEEMNESRRNFTLIVPGKGVLKIRVIICLHIF